jgi:DNA-binding Lrp family transcriptional regulator
MKDDIDEKILQALKENARMTFVDIGRSVGLSEGAVRNRIQALVDSGVIRRFTVEVATSVGVRALTMISVDPSTPTSAVSEAVGRMNVVERIYEITGEYDIAVVVSSPDIEAVNRCIEEIRGVEGVVRTNTMIVLRTL